MNNKTKLLHRIIVCFLIILVSISVFLYRKYTPIFLRLKNVEQIKITTINNLQNHTKEQEIIIEDQETIHKILDTINHRFYYNRHLAKLN